MSNVMHDLCAGCRLPRRRHAEARIVCPLQTVATPLAGVARDGSTNHLRSLQFASFSWYPEVELPRLSQNIRRPNDYG